MTTATNAETLRQYKSRFYLIIEQILVLIRALAWLEKLRIWLQVSYELRNDVLRCR